MDTTFDAEWETLSQISKTSRFSERVNLSYDFQESVDHFGKTRRDRSISDRLSSEATERERSMSLSSEWATSLGSNRLDLILTASSLTEGSSISLHSDCDVGDDDILSTAPFDEEAVQSRDSITINEKEEAIQSHCISTKEKQREENTKMSTNDDLEFTGVESISYAQLYFDKETKALVTLLEISSQRKNGTGRRQHYHLERQKDHVHNGIPLHRSLELPSKSDFGKSFAKSNDTRVSRSSIEGWNDRDDDDSPFHDETLSTECSSLSSVTFRKNDSSHRECDCGEDWVISTKNLYPPSPVRFSDEPIVFSNDGSMEQKLCWLDEADLGLYLLEDCDDPWDYGTSSRGCGQSIKKLLNASRFCISLTQLGESKWRASSAYHRAPDFSKGDNHKVKFERMSYSILNDM